MNEIRAASGPNGVSKPGPGVHSGVNVGVTVGDEVGVGVMDGIKLGVGVPSFE